MNDPRAEGLIRHAVDLPTGVTLNVMERPGNGTPVILLHGIWDSWDYFLPLADPGLGTLARRPLFLVDHRGHGESSKPDSGYAWPDYVNDLLALVETLGFERVTLGGHSLGSITSLLAAARTPDKVESLLLEDPPIPMTIEGHDSFGILLELKQRPFEVIVDEFMAWRPWLTREAAEGSANRLLSTADGVLREAANGILGEEEIPTPGVVIDAPTLVIQAGIPEQQAFKDEGRDILNSVIPQLVVEKIPDTSHNVLREQPEIYCKIVAAFFGD
jgi:N-formylmaleamate deformylase